jgi:L-threonylcarbamoyladenylate synthase
VDRSSASGPISAWRLNLIARTLDQGGVIAYPTEGVWGLGCLPESSSGAAQILWLKQRSLHQGLLLVGADQAQFDPYLEGLTEAERAELGAHWPGPVTYLVPDNGFAPKWIVGEHQTLGLRVSAHPLVAQLCRTLGPLVSTSANISGRPAAMSALDVRRYFGGHVDLIVPGNLGGRVGPSEIRMLGSGQRVR